MIQAAKPLLHQLLKAANVCPSHGYGHALRVMHITAEALRHCVVSQIQQENVMLAALLHDADDRKLFGSGSQNAEDILVKIGISPERLASINQMIELVSFSKNQEGLKGNVSIIDYYPRYADRLEAIGKIGVVRAYTYGKGKKRALFVQSTPKPKNRVQLLQVIKGRDEQYRKLGTSDSFVDHFYDKLLHIACPKQLQEIPYFKSEFQKRKQEIEDFILEFTVRDFEGMEVRLQELQRQFKTVSE